ncbi:MAG: alpha/beta fold hydrolase, partial [Candidatus Saccharimonadales bacterium]
MKEIEITVKNLAVHYKIFGAGRPLLILHGWQSSSERWTAVAEILAKKDVCVIVPDLPGFGKSAKPETAWSMDDYVEWLRKFTEKVPELQNTFALAGHSFGGALAAKFSIKYRQPVGQLFLISAAVRRERTLGKKLLGTVAKAGKPLAGIPLARKAFYKFLVRRSDYLYQQDIMKDTYLKVIADDLSYKISFLKVPVVLIWGDKDESTPVAEAEFIRKKLLHSTLEKI